MSEWKRNKRRTNGFPKGIEEGMVLEVRFRSGDIERRTVGLVGGSNLDLVNPAHFNTKDGYSVDVMAYRIVSKPAAAQDITPPYHSKGFPVGTTAKDIGAKVGDEFVHADDGEEYTLSDDDGSVAPIFTDSAGRDWSIAWNCLAPTPPKTAIELQAEEVGIPEPVQEWPEDRVDVIGQNGNDGLHYASEQQAAEADKRIDDAAQVVREAFGSALPTNKYQRTIKGVTVDVYDALAAFGVTCQARGHAIKKLLMAGQRGHKDEAQDLREAVQAIERSIELIGK